MTVARPEPASQEGRAEGAELHGRSAQISATDRLDANVDPRAVRPTEDSRSASASEAEEEEAAGYELGDPAAEIGLSVSAGVRWSGVPRSMTCSQRCPPESSRASPCSRHSAWLQGAAISAVVPHADTVQAERQEIGRARLVTAAVLTRELRAADLVLARLLPLSEQISAGTLWGRRAPWLVQPR